MDDALYNWRENVAEFYNEYFSEEEQEIIYEIIRGNVGVDALKEKFDEFFNDEDLPMHPEFDVTTEQGILNRLEFDIGYVGGSGTRSVYRFN